MMKAAAATLMLAGAASAAVPPSQPKTAPSTGQEWISLDKGMEFQPANGDADMSPEHRTLLRQAQKRLLQDESSSSSSQESENNVPYVDSTETYYDGYAQAWRYVGFYADCSPDQDNDRRRERQLNEDEEDSPCVRYLLWAAYVDLGYTGLGIGEYQFFDTYAQEWDASACETVGNGVTITVDEETGEQTKSIDSSTCKKMDCHLPNGSNNWQLMGYFKEVEYTEWFEQLFKHEGYCVWQEGEYDFMYENYGAWPEGCTATETQLSDGTLLYYDTKVETDARMTYGLYTDAKCSVDYQGEEVTMESVLLSGGDDGGGDGDLLSIENLNYWNDAMEIYRVCQPCRAYALNENYGDDDRRRRLAKQHAARHRRHGRRLDDNDPNNGLWQCDDAAGYTNVNQCMKFRTKTDMEYASLEEVMEAAQQGGVTSVTVSGRTYGSYMAGTNAADDEPNWALLWSGVGILCFGLATLVAAMMWTKTRCRGSSKNASLKEPLI